MTLFICLLPPWLTDPGGFASVMATRLCSVLICLPLNGYTGKVSGASQPESARRSSFAYPSLASSGEHRQRHVVRTGRLAGDEGLAGARDHHVSQANDRITISPPALPLPHTGGRQIRKDIPHVRLAAFDAVARADDDQRRVHQCV